MGKDNQEEFQHFSVKMAWRTVFSMVPGRTRINVKLTENNGESTVLTFQALRSVKKVEPFLYRIT